MKVLKTSSRGRDAYTIHKFLEVRRGIQVIGVVVSGDVAEVYLPEDADEGVVERALGELTLDTTVRQEDVLAFELEKLPNDAKIELLRRFVSRLTDKSKIDEVIHAQ